MRLANNDSSTLFPPTSSEPIEQPLAFEKYHQKPLPPLYNYLPGKRISEDTRIRILAQNSGYVSSYFFQLAKTWDQVYKKMCEVR
jgi:hypothetical protein